MSIQAQKVLQKLLEMNESEGCTFRTSVMFRASDIEHVDQLAHDVGVSRATIIRESVALGLYLLDKALEEAESNAAKAARSKGKKSA